MLKSSKETVHTVEILVRALQEPHRNTPLHPLQDQHHFALTNLAEKFNTKATKILGVANLLET